MARKGICCRGDMTREDAGSERGERAKSDDAEIGISVSRSVVNDRALICLAHVHGGGGGDSESERESEGWSETHAGYNV